MKVVVSRESLDNMLEPKEDGTSPRTAEPRAEIIIMNAMPLKES